MHFCAGDKANGLVSFSHCPFPLPQPYCSPFTCDLARAIRTHCATRRFLSRAASPSFFRSHHDATVVCETITQGEERIPFLISLPRPLPTTFCLSSPRQPSWQCALSCSWPRYSCRPLPWQPRSLKMVRCVGVVMAVPQAGWLRKGRRTWLVLATKTQKRGKGKKKRNARDATDRAIAARKITTDTQ